MRSLESRKTLPPVSAARVASVSWESLIEARWELMVEPVNMPAPRILAVTALTSLSDAEVNTLGFGPSAAEMAGRLADVAVKAGAGGLVCSAHEARALRARYPAVFLCTPGIRPAGVAAGDQARVETPSAAIAAGSSLLVVGRALHGAPDPAAAARALHDEVGAALVA